MDFFQSRIKYAHERMTAWGNRWGAHDSHGICVQMCQNASHALYSNSSNRHPQHFVRAPSAQHCLRRISRATSYSIWYYVCAILAVRLYALTALLTWVVSRLLTMQKGASINFGALSLPVTDANLLNTKPFHFHDGTHWIPFSFEVTEYETAQWRQKMLHKEEKWK